MRLVKERSVAAARAARAQDVLRKWMREQRNPQQAFAGQGVMNPEQAEIQASR